MKNQFNVCGWVFLLMWKYANHFDFEVENIFDVANSNCHKSVEMKRDSVENYALLQVVRSRASIATCMSTYPNIRELPPYPGPPVQKYQGYSYYHVENMDPPVIPECKPYINEPNVQASIPKVLHFNYNMKDESEYFPFEYYVNLLLVLRIQPELKSICPRPQTTAWDMVELVANARREYNYVGRYTPWQ